jgi:hypothetical protein
MCMQRIAMLEVNKVGTQKCVKIYDDYVECLAKCGRISYISTHRSSDRGSREENHP